METASPHVDPRLEAARERLRAHPVYATLGTRAGLVRFAEHHVVCVLDFMSLLKSLQRELSCVEVPWRPSGHGELGAFIHELVLAEEFDRTPGGRVLSHFEWYLEAMDEIGADTAPARGLVASLGEGLDLAAALRRSTVPAAARDFGLHTASVLEKPLHVRAAVFLHGREELVPELFRPVLDRLAAAGLPCAMLRGYLDRHVELDTEDHGPLARRLLERLLADHPAGAAAAATEADTAAREALLARERLWDAVAAG